VAVYVEIRGGFRFKRRVFVGEKSGTAVDCRRVILYSLFLRMLAVLISSVAGKQEGKARSTWTVVSIT
jgi:hypothetical protein